MRNLTNIEEVDARLINYIRQHEFNLINELFTPTGSINETYFTDPKKFIYNKPVIEFTFEERKKFLELVNQTLEYLPVNEREGENGINGFMEDNNSVGKNLGGKGEDKRKKMATEGVKRKDDTFFYLDLTEEERLIMKQRLESELKAYSKLEISESFGHDKEENKIKKKKEIWEEVADRLDKERNKEELLKNYIIDAVKNDHVLREELERSKDPELENIKKLMDTKG
ncbi:hypothetical protein K502DRAFT_93770 [Neoconidiobolus thromboides FSU 785]|nr:hypothetical protein K502DRAFT_93770 [Neoconidiobolus thromboides FSU 785]